MIKFETYNLHWQFVKDMNIISFFHSFYTDLCPLLVRNVFCLNLKTGIALRAGETGVQKRQLNPSKRPCDRHSLEQNAAIRG